METFCLEDYDSVGFDLDCTLAEYNLKELMKLVYTLLKDYLVEKKGYPRDCLSETYEEGEFFAQKGLVMDLKKGNVLKLAENGLILKGAHGTKLMSEEQVADHYGWSRVYEDFEDIVQDPLSLFKTKRTRTVLDCFDTPSILIFARLVDAADKENGKPLEEYNVWPDILEGLYYIYDRNAFVAGRGGFYAALKSNPSRFYKKWSQEKVAWLRELKKKKFIFVLTGSYIDFASLTATECIGENWKEYFDIILCHARKPFFFTDTYPFLCVEGDRETGTVEGSALKKKGVYSRGNWSDLKKFIQKCTGTSQPKCVYVGDNLLQDIYSPVSRSCCDTVAVSVEMKEDFGFSTFWGSYFGEEGAQPELVSFSQHLIRSCAKICVSGLDVFVQKPLSFRYNTLKDNEQVMSEDNGYYKF